MDTGRKGNGCRGPTAWKEKGTLESGPNYVNREISRSVDQSMASSGLKFQLKWKEQCFLIPLALFSPWALSACMQFR